MKSNLPFLEPEKKKLPDLDKYWKAVNDDSTDFTAWTYLLQYVDQEVGSDAMCYLFWYCKMSSSLHRVILRQHAKHTMHS